MGEEESEATHLSAVWAQDPEKGAELVSARHSPALSSVEISCLGPGGDLRTRVEGSSLQDASWWGEPMRQLPKGFSKCRDRQAKHPAEEVRAPSLRMR